MVSSGKRRPPELPVEFLGNTEEEIASFPLPVKKVIGFAIFLAQIGGKHTNAKPLTGDKAFKGASVIEIVEDYDGDTYRAVYTAKLAGVVYVLDAFQKKSKKGIRTPKAVIDRIKERLKRAKALHKENYEKLQKTK
jgi:phage-related protein